VEVVDAPQWLQVAEPGALLLPPAASAAALADVLDLPLVSERPAPRLPAGATQAVPAEVRALLPAAPHEWLEHERLDIEGREVSWWVDERGPHATTLDGLARALAWAAGAWQARHLVSAVLAEPERLETLRAEADLD
jgi:hypothetical protein